MLARALALLLLVSPAAALESSASKNTTWVSATVSVEIRNADGTSKKFTGIPWTLDLTVIKAMQQIDGLKFSADWYYSFNDWYISEIDGKKGQGKDKPNWSYCVNGSPAHIGVSSYRLSPNSSIAWIYSAEHSPKCD